MEGIEQTKYLIKIERILTFAIQKSTKDFLTKLPTTFGNKLVELVGKRPREPMKCWGCGGDNLLRIFPHRH